MAQQQQQQQRPRITTESRALSSEELTRVLQEASRRHGEALKSDETREVTTVEDAYALAQELGIPEEHVREALSAQARKREGGMLGGVVLLSGVAALVVGGVVKLLGLPLLLALVVAVAAGVAVLSVGLIAAAMKRNPAKQSGPPPVAGTCRVCLRPAHTPESTFCEEHRYK